MKRMERGFLPGSVGIVLFAVWTVLVKTVDVSPAGQSGADVGFAALNSWFHEMTGVHMVLYTITDWLGLIPVLVCIGFGTLGLAQMIRRKGLFRVDFDILLLGAYYMTVVLGYLVFEIFPVNYRPVLINGRLEASYPSSTTLLVLGVMPTLVLQAKRRLSGARLQTAIKAVAMAYTLLMIIGRLLSGVHWATDIVGALLFSWGLFSLYRAAVLRKDH